MNGTPQRNMSAGGYLEVRRNKRHNLRRARNFAFVPALEWL